MSTPTKAMDAKEVTTKSTVVRNVEGDVVVVAKVLAEVPKSPWTPRPIPTTTKESVKDKKRKQVAIPVCATPRRSPLKDKPTAQENGKAINL